MWIYMTINRLNGKMYVGEPGRRAIFEMITRQREKYSWEFLFLGANQDDIATATSLGISVDNAVTYTADKVGTKGLITGLSAGISRLRSGRAARGAIYGQQDYEAAVKGTDKSS